MTLETLIPEAQAPAVAAALEETAAAKAAATMEASAASAAAASVAAALNPFPKEDAPPPPAASAAEPLPAAAREEEEEEEGKAASAASASSAVARRWASLLSSARADAQAAFLLRQVRACPRCCLRFAGVRDARAYAPPAPSRAALLAALIGGKGEGGEGGEGGGGKEEQEGREASPPSPPCSVCLGVLQSPEPAFPLPLPSDKMAAVAAAMDMGAGTWVACGSGTGESVGAVVEREGHYSSPSSSSTSHSSCSSRIVSLQVSFPASVGLRQASASAALAVAGLPAAKPSMSGGSGGSLGPESITDVKDAVKAAVSPSLSKALGGMRITTANDESAFLTVSLQFVHPATAREVERVPSLAGGKRSRQGGKGSVFVPTGGSDGKGCWKKRKRVPAADCAALGRAASQALMSGCARLDLKSLTQANFSVPPPPAPSMPHLLVRARASPLFVGGRYLKLLRDVSQSPFFDEKGDRRGRTSVQEEIERFVLPLFAQTPLGGGCDGCKFITAGREDLDVRCLGKGRPFILEIANAKLGGGGPPSQEALDAARRKLKESACGVELDALAMVGKKELAMIKEGETSKQKSYEAVCWLPCEGGVGDEVIASINGAVRRAEEEEEVAGQEGKGLVLKQTTPARVEHRRAMLVRERAIHEMSAERVPGKPQQILLRLRTQAGLYVKEFVHGDGGRTVPSLIDVAGLRGRKKKKKSEEKKGEESSAAAAAAAAGDDDDDDASAPAEDDEEVEAAKCLSLDVREIHLDFL